MGVKPVIAAWFFTHPHGDHLALVLQFLREYRDQVVIELFAYNFADYSAVARANDVSSESSYMSLINDLKSVITANYPNAKKFTFHTGQRLYLRNAYVDIYYTHEDLYPTNVDYGNNTSAAFKINVSGTDIMILGDADTPCSNFMEKVYGSAMKSEILQPSHHGYNGGTLELYKLIAPKVCLWACPTDIFEKGKVNNFEYNLYLKQTAKEHYASDYTTTIKLPYQG